MYTYLHYPNHLFTSRRNVKYMWSIRDSNDGYLSRFLIKSVEMVKRRNKGRRPCKDWDNYDDSILENHIKKVGCRAPYQKALNGFEICSTNDSMKASSFEINADHELIPPCKYMGKILYDYEENDNTATATYKEGYLRIGIYFSDGSFKEITQTR